MNDLLNPNQRRSVRVTLRAFEEDLRYIQDWLQGADSNGILYRRRLIITPETRQAAHKLIEAAFEQIADLARLVELEHEAESPAGLIRGMMSVDWANLLDAQSAKLKRFGEANPELKNEFDPAILQLAQVALELANIFDEQAEVDKHSAGASSPADDNASVVDSNSISGEK